MITKNEKNQFVKPDLYGTPIDLLKRINGWKDKDSNHIKEKEALYHALYTLLDSVCISKSAGIDDCSHILFWPQLKFMCQLYEYYSNKEGVCFEKSDYDDIHDFIVRIFLTVSAANNSNHRFFQSPSLDPYIFSFPLKMSLFYAAFIDKAKSFLIALEGGSENQYEFFLSPSLFQQIEVKEFFSALSKRVSEDDYTGDKLLFISAAECELYHTSFLLPLMHEIVHFVGNTVRCRKERYEVLVLFVSKLIVESIWLTFKESIKLPEELVESTQPMLESMLKMIVDELSKYRDEIRNKKYGQYGSLLKEDFAIYVNSVIETHFDEFVKPIESTIWQYLKELPNRKLYDMYKMSPYSVKNTDMPITRTDAANEIVATIKDDLYFVREKFAGRSIFKKGVQTQCSKGCTVSGIYFKHESIPVISKCINDFLYLSREVYADVIAIISFNADLDTYFTQLLKNCDGLIDGLTFARVKAVVRTLAKMDESIFVCPDIDSDSAFRSALIEQYKFLFSTSEENCSMNDNWYLRSTFLDETLLEYAECCYTAYKLCLEKNAIAATQQKSLHDSYRDVKEAPNIVDAILGQEDLLQSYMKKCDWERNLRS